MSIEALIRQFREKTLIFLKNSGNELSREFPDVSFGIDRQDDSSHIYLSALITDATLDQPDLVEIGVSMDRLSSGTYLINADVAWGADGFGSVEGSSYREPIKVDEASLEKIYHDLPRLVSILKTALRRRKPHDWDKIKKMNPRANHSEGNEPTSQPWQGKSERK